MRFFEFQGDDTGDKLVIVLRNYIGRAASKKAPSKLNWNGLQQVLKTNGFEMAADYETFKAIYDGSPAVQAMVKNFNDQGIELNVPGAPDEEPKGNGTQSPEDSQAAVDKAAASAAPQQLAQQTATPKI
jgi:hypothetical protein